MTFQRILLQASFKVELASWDIAHLGCVPIAELTLPPATQLLVHRATRLLASEQLLRGSRSSLVALHGVPRAVAWNSTALAAFSLLRRLHFAAASEPEGSVGAPAFLPGAFPEGLQELDMPVPRHPFTMAAHLPAALDSLTLRCTGDFVVGPATLDRAVGWRRLAVEATNTAGLDLTALSWAATALHDGWAAAPAGQPRGSGGGGQPGLSGRCLELHARRVMLTTSDPGHLELLAAPPVRSLRCILGQYVAVLAPVLAAAGIQTLRMAATEASFYCHRPGRRAILDADGLPPSGRVRLAVQDQPGGYAAELEWPVEDVEPSTPSGVEPAWQAGMFLGLTITRPH